MYLSGMKKGTICKKNRLNLKLLEEWILEYQIEHAIKLYLKGESEEKICKVLKIDKAFLIKLISSKKFIKSTNIKPSGRTDGFSNWIDKIVK
jgi:hypothetical protein